MSGRIVVINPNSTEAVTRGIDEAACELRFVDGPVIDCLTLAEGPPGIQSQRDVDHVVPPLCRMIEREDGSSSAFVIACFSDPGLYAARETTRRPVFGIMESGMTTALTLGASLGVIAILQMSIPRHTRAFRAMGIMERVAGELAVDLPVVELSDERRTFGRLVEIGGRLCREKGADVLVMGCAGMARYRTRLQDELGVSVIDPSQAAIGMAITALRLGYRSTQPVRPA